jgi:CubicO group peptidase (beta-lactamase class C family)
VAASVPGSDDVGALLATARQAGLAPGWVALVTRPDGRGRAWTVGRATIDGPSVEVDLLFDLASLTKPLAVTTLLLLARRDGLALETPLVEVLPEFDGSAWGGVTLAQCAAHVAGFPAWAPLYALGERSREGYLASLARIAPLAPPGRSVVYSSLDFIALGFALERCGGTDLATLFRDHVAAPLGIGEEILFAPSHELTAAGGERRWFVETRMLAERGLPGEPPPRLEGAISVDDGNARGLGGIAGNAGLFGSAAAVAQLAAEFLPGGGVLLGAEEAALATRCWTEGLESARGLGWQLAASPGCSAGPALSAAALGHVGFTGTSAWVEPETRTVMVLLGNRLHPGGRTPELHPLRRRFHALALRSGGGAAPRAPRLCP